MAQKIKTATTAKTMENLTSMANARRIDEWGKFLELSECQKKSRGHSKEDQSMMWIDADIKRKFEQMKINGLDCPVRYMVNAALKVFLDANKEQVNKFLSL